MYTFKIYQNGKLLINLSSKSNLLEFLNKHMLLMLIDDARVPAHKFLLFINTKLLVQVSEKKIDQPLYAGTIKAGTHVI